MEIKTCFLEIQTKGYTDIQDITGDVQKIVDQERFREGNVNLFVVGSTAGITTVEYEPGLVKTDLPRLFEKLAPYRENYAHHGTWGDNNGASHLRASLLGSSLVGPFRECKLVLGTWQQIVCIDFDTSPRRRKIVVQITGKF